MFTCLCLDSDGESSLVVMLGSVVAPGDERFKLLECSVYIVIAKENLVFFSTSLSCAM